MAEIVLGCVGISVEWSHLARKKVALNLWSNYAVNICHASWDISSASYYDIIHLTAAEMYQLANE